MTTKYTLYDNTHECRCVLYYGLKLVTDTSKGCIEIDSVMDLFKFDKYVDVKSKLKELGTLYKLGCGTYDIVFDGVHIGLEVRNFIDNHKMLHTYNFNDNTFTKQVIIECESSCKIQSFIEKSIEYVKNYKNEFINSIGTLKKYIYDAKDAYWNDSHSTHFRSLDSLFLKEGEKERIIGYIDDFTNPESKKDYIRFNIPYKSNILLYGKPGTGKTSTILTIASHLKTNIGLIPISSALDDSGLINALSDVKKNDCKIVVIEDIDCLFSDRKKHDSEKNALTLSGLLNCMDGLFRAEGIIVFLTTNNIEALDDAMIRSARIDLKLEYTYADEYQIRQCFEYYFPKQMANFARFYDKINFKEFTIADMQAFFFRFRKCDNILEHMATFADMHKKARSQHESMYL